MNELNAKVVAEFRANAGRVVNAMGGHFKDIHLLLLHTVGRHSGNKYVTPLLYVEDGDAYVLVGLTAEPPKSPSGWPMSLPCQRSSSKWVTRR